jgi:hypothetical protein
MMDTILNTEGTMGRGIGHDRVTGQALAVEGSVR